MTRRAFFTAPFSFVSDLDDVSPATVDEQVGSDDLDTDFFNEVPAELLAMEAERLGLSSDADDAEVRRAVQAALEGFKQSS